MGSNVFVAKVRPSMKQKNMIECPRIWMFRGVEGKICVIFSRCETMIYAGILIGKAMILVGGQI